LKTKIFSIAIKNALAYSKVDGLAAGFRRYLQLQLIHGFLDLDQHVPLKGSPWHGDLILGGMVVLATAGFVPPVLLPATKTMLRRFTEHQLTDWHPGAKVMIHYFCRFSHIFGEKLAFFLKTSAKIEYLEKL
jgi:hypothetical protein